MGCYTAIAVCQKKNEYNFSRNSFLISGYQIRQQRSSTTGCRKTLEINDDDLNIHSGLDTDVGDLPDNISWGVDVEDSLVDSHLPSIVGVRSLTAR